jgi:hypothetical protein
MDTGAMTTVAPEGAAAFVIEVSAEILFTAFAPVGDS